MTPATVDTDENLIILGDEVAMQTSGEIRFDDDFNSKSSDMILDFGATNSPVSKDDGINFFLQDIPMSTPAETSQTPVVSSDDFLFDFGISDIAPITPTHTEEVTVSSEVSFDTDVSEVEIAVEETHVTDAISVPEVVVETVMPPLAKNLGDRLTILDRAVAELEGRKSEIESLKSSKSNQIESVNAQMEALKVTLQDYEAELADFTKEENIIIKDISSIQKMKSEDALPERARWTIKK